MSKQEAFIFTTSPYMDKLTVITSITTSDLPCHNVTLQRRNYVLFITLLFPCG
jgi:hypothetical protein